MQSTEMILIVDDSPTQAVRLQQLLKSAEIGALVVRSADEAVASLKRGIHFRAILSDINMPGTDGFDLCRQFKQLDEARSIPFFLLVSLHDHLDAVKAMNACADNVLLKSYDKDFFINQLQNALKNAEAISSEPLPPVSVYLDGQLFTANQSKSTLAAMVVSIFSMAQYERSLRMQQTAVK